VKVSAVHHSPTALLGLATAAAQEAGRLLLDGLRSGPAVVEAKTSRTDPVSDLDRASEALILTRLLSERPDDAVMAEEGSDRSGTSPVRWVIDPLDGTVNFVYGIPVFAVSIAAEVDGTVVAGVVHDPNRAETFSATLGGGAFLNGKPISANNPTDLSVALVGTGFAYDAEVRRVQGSRLDELLAAVRDIRRAGSAALDLCAVGAGRLDAYFERGTHHWDRAAGALVAREAGAVVGDLAGDEPSDVLVMAAASSIAAPFRALLTSIGASW
jgi:myo-inositol-1(or 4)-monophosphatase